MSPFTPFFTEVLYQNMRKVSTGAEESIHYCSFPQEEGEVLSNFFCLKSLVCFGNPPIFGQLWFKGFIFILILESFFCEIGVLQSHESFHFYFVNHLFINKLLNLHHIWSHLTLIDFLNLQLKFISYFELKFFFISHQFRDLAWIDL